MINFINMAGFNYSVYLSYVGILSHREFVIGLCVVCIACLCNRCTEVGLIYWVWIKLCLEAECIAVIVFDSALAFLSLDKVGSIKLDSDTVGVYLHLYATLRWVCCCDLFYSRSCLVYCKIVIISTSIVKLCIICLNISSDWLSLCKINGVPSTGAISPVGIALESFTGV